jgi:signal transduction histidine kinase
MAQQVKQAAERARDLVAQLLAFGRKQVLQPLVLDLRGVVTEFEPLLRRTIRENVRIEVRIPQVTAPVRADRGQLEQVLMNLAVNA